MSHAPEHETVLLTAGEVASILRVHKVTVYRWAEEGTLKAVRIGNDTVRFRREDIDAMIGNGAAPEVAS